MQNPQTASPAELEGVGLRSSHARSIVLAQVYPLAPLHASDPDAITLDATVDDYQPVDNHRALINGWKRLSPAQQWFTGGCIGLTLGFGAIAGVTNMQKAIAFAPAALGDAKTMGRTQSALRTIYQRLGEVGAPLTSPAPVTTPTSGVQPLLQPVMMDRFYLPIPATDAGPAADSPAAMVVDRFYFDPRQSVDASPGQASAQTSDAQPLVVPLPPPGPQALVQPPEASTAMAHRSPNSTIPSPSARPTLSPQSPPPPTTTQIGSATTAPSPQNHRLLGVVQTGQFSAALVQTGQSSYAVRLGEWVSQSPWQLVDVQDRSVTLRYGSEQVVIHVGDTF